MDSINERFKIIIDMLGMNANSFSTELNMRSTAMYNIINGKNKPSYDLLKSIIEKYNVNPSWLLSGDGDVFLTKNRGYIDTIGELSSEDFIRLYSIGFLSEKTVNHMIASLSEREILNVALMEYSKVKKLYENYSMLVDLAIYIKMPKNFIERFPILKSEEFYAKLQIDTLPTEKEKEERDKNVWIRKYLYLKKESERMQIELDNLILCLSLDRDLIEFRK